jgi:hypothetical protein
MNTWIARLKKRLRRFKYRQREMQNDPLVRKKNDRLLLFAFTGFLIFLAYACWISGKNP